MTADRVPQPGEVWQFRHLAGLGRGHVEILPSPGVDEVTYRYLANEARATRDLRSFVRDYDWLAGSVDEAPVQAYGAT